MASLTLSINNEIDALLAAVDAKAAENDAGQFAFIPQLVSIAHQRAAELRLTAEETQVSISSEERDQIGAELDDFASKIRTGYLYRTGEKDLPDWMKSGRKTDRDFYAGIFANLDSLDADFQAWFAADAGIDLAVIRTRYARWDELAAVEAARSDALEKVRAAIDLKALLAGVLRYYGTSGFDVRRATMGEA